LGGPLPTLGRGSDLTGATYQETTKAADAMPTRIRDIQAPLHNCPGFSVWRRYEGSKYLVFVDESFFMFFDEMTAQGGYFCHSTVGLPENEYAAIVSDLGVVLREYQQLVAGATEFKHSEFKRLELRPRRRIALALRDALLPHGCFIGGFYTPVRSYVLEQVRTTLLLGRSGDEIPDDLSVVYPQAVKDLKACRDGPGDSDIISRLLQVPMASVGNLLASLSCPFEVIYDPRGKKEDKAVRAGVSEYMRIFDALKSAPPLGLRTDVNDHFKGLRYDKTSDQELGLQVADLMAGEVTAFLRANPELMSFGANKRLVTQTSHERLSAVETIEGMLFKTGTYHKMPLALSKRFFKPDSNGRTVFHYFTAGLASGTLTCYSGWGQPRHLMPFDRLILDQID
jgi:hypothetical protein